MDTLTNIFKRLRVKSILRFQCVCKDWGNLFKTKIFIDQHKTHSAQENPLLLLHSYDPYFKKPSLRVLNPNTGTIESLSIPSIDSFMRHGWTIVDSCNGLLCVELKNPGRNILLWNPATNEVREIPKFRNFYYYFIRGVGFGFSGVVNDYKIVQFYNKDTDGCDKSTKRDGVGVFSLITGLWKELEFEGLNDIFVYGHGLNVDGTIFWLGFQHGFSTILISFDIATEVLKIISLPAEDGFSRLISLFGFGVYENKLVGQYPTTEGPQSHFMCVGVLEEVASESGSSLSCTQRYRVGPMPIMFRPRCYWRNEVVFWENNVTDQVEDDPKCCILMVNLNTNERRRFNYSIDFQCDGFGFDAFNYIESLVSVRNIQVE